MASMALSSSLAAQSSSHNRHHVFPPKRCFLSIDSAKQTHHIALSLHSSTPISKKPLRLSSVCFSKDNNKSKAGIQPKVTFLTWIGGNPLVDIKDGYCGQGLAFLTDVLGRLLPLVGSSSISTAYLVGITSVLAPLLEETLFRGFLMVSLSESVLRLQGQLPTTETEKGHAANNCRHGPFKCKMK
ncbi:hypothetical protein CFP56_004033 [Quercus suber]|uniref:Uncharacterized protein n=1 Tax=Quercus suber TaxID=58331 RepID=A0AAW0IIA0_QUESU